MRARGALRIDDLACSGQREDLDRACSSGTLQTRPFSHERRTAGGASVPTLEELFQDRAALDLAMRELLSVMPVELRTAMATEPRGPREIAAFQQMCEHYAAIGELPALMFRTALAAGIISRELHAFLEEGGENTALRFSDDCAAVVDGSCGPAIRRAEAIVRTLADALVISEVNAAFLWQSFVHLMCTHYRRPTFFRLRVEHDGSIRLLRPAHATAQSTNV